MESREQQKPSDRKARHSEIYAKETLGLLCIGFLLLVFTVIRYWRVIHWSVR